MKTTVRILLFCLALPVAGCGTLQSWHKWDLAEQRRYLGLLAVAGEDEASRYRALPVKAQRDSLYEAYWRSLDSTGQALGGHQKNVTGAWLEFGSDGYFVDERSFTWIRHGQPDLRRTASPVGHVESDQQLADGTFIIGRGWEIWEYSGLGICYDFLQGKDTYAKVAATYSGRRHAIAYFAADDSQNTALSVAPGGNESRSWGIDFRTARFKSEQPGKVRWELYWRTPLAIARDRTFTGAFHILKDSRTVLADTVRYAVRIAGDTVREPYVFGQKNFDLAPGHYRLQFSLAGDGLAGARDTVTDAELVAYKPGIQEASDIEMVTLQDSSFISADFRKGQFLRVVPGFDEAVPLQQPFYVYYEAYPFRTGPDGRHRIKITHQIFASDADRIPKACVIDTGPEYNDERGDTYYNCEKIHPINLTRGGYLLVINLEDALNPSRTTKLTHYFAVKK